MTAPHNPMDPVSVVAYLLTPVVGVAVADAVSAYAAIVVAWSVGVLVGLLRMPPDERALGMRPGWRRTAAFTLGSGGLVLGTTPLLAELLAGSLQQVLPEAAGVTARSLCFVIAWAVPAVGHSWPSLLPALRGWWARRPGVSP